MLSPYMEFDQKNGNLIAIRYPINLTEVEKKEILSYLWRIRNNRKYKLGKYKAIIQVIRKVKLRIKGELKN